MPNDEMPSESATVKIGPGTGQGPPPPPPRISRIGRYEILARLSAGAFGEVYAACLRGAADFGTLVAIKLLHPALMSDPQVVAAFAEEARIGGRLIHPHIARVMEFAEEDGTWYLVMELVDGVSFTQIVARQADRGDVGVGSCLELIAQACEGLHFAHGAVDSHGRRLGLVHRDVKPSNLMLDRAGPVKVMDFGIAKVKLEGREATLTGTLKGTPAYMSPEAALGRSDVDARSDVFAAGVVLYELLTAQRLYPGATMAVIHMAAAADVAPALEGLRARVPAPVVEVVERALRRERHERFTTAEEMAEACRRAARVVGDEPRLKRLAAQLCPPPMAWGQARPPVVGALAAPRPSPTPVPQTLVEGAARAELATLPGGAQDVTERTPPPPGAGPSSSWRSVIGGALGGLGIGAALLAVYGGDSPAPAVTGVEAAPPLATAAPATPAPATPAPATPAPERAAASAAPGARTTRAPATVAVLINTSPEEQPIWINGKLQARPTPWRGNLAPGTHTVQVGEAVKGRASLQVEPGKAQQWLGFLKDGAWTFEKIN